jgi:hypothetical protein
VERGWLGGASIKNPKSIFFATLSNPSIFDFHVLPFPASYLPDYQSALVINVLLRLDQVM